MKKKHFVSILQKLENSSYNAIVELFKANKILLLDFTGSDVEIEAFSYNDDETATNVKIVKIELDETGCLDFIDSTGFSHSLSDLHIGSMPYIYEKVTRCCSYIGRGDEL
jgi:dimeric dUTPase (all-alpha-NTP-PPase superfamily)